jgi:photosystem II stability/assembly factor-like uncharacterized protein
MNKIVLYLVLIVVMLSYEQVYGQWEFTKCPTTNDLNAIYLLGNGSGWIVGDKGTILRKTGNKWLKNETPTEENLHAVAFNDDNDGWAVGSNGTIIHFNGTVWTIVNCPTKRDLYSISFNDTKSGVAVGELGTILVYEDGIWKSRESKIRGDLFSVNFKNKNAWLGGGLECVGVPIIQMANNKGQITLNKYKSDATINSIAFLSPENGWAAGSQSTLLHFNGIDWERPLIQDKFSSLRSIFFSDINNGISVGYGGTILTFKDNVWTSESISTEQDLNSTAICDSIYYAVGNQGTILTKCFKTDPYNASITNKEPLDVKLYPNPCDDELNMLLRSDYDFNLVHITLTSASGQVVAEKDLNAIRGSSKFTLETKVLANGLYFIQVKCGTRTSVNKIIISH